MQGLSEKKSLARRWGGRSWRGGVWLLGSKLPVVPEFGDDLTLQSLGRAEASTAEDPEEQA